MNNDGFGFGSGDGFGFGSGAVSVLFQPLSSLLRWWHVAQVVVWDLGVRGVRCSDDGF
ncbi:hypothetical protein A2U01_0042064, partial [Trifolium medium]|nr:hypothetical protein [Trifolium medium]